MTEDGFTNSEAGIQRRVGLKIRELRIAKGITTTELARQAEISQGQLSKIENGRVAISARILARLCDILDRPLSYLFQRDQEIPRVLGTLATVDGPEKKAIQRFAQEVYRHTGGKISLIVLSLSQLGPGGHQVQQLAEGIIDLFIDELLYFHRFIPDFGIFAIPYVFRKQAHQQAFLRTAYFRTQMVEQLRGQGIRFLNRRWNWLRGVERVLVSRKPIVSPDQIRGLRVRIFDSNPLEAFWRAMGAQPVVIPWPEVAGALKKGLVDVVPTHKSHVYLLGFCKHAPFVTRLGDVAPVLGLAMNEVKHQILPPVIQDTLQNACVSGGDFFSDLVLREEQDNERLNIRQFKAAYLTVDIEAWQAAARNVHRRMESENLFPQALWQEVANCRQSD